MFNDFNYDYKVDILRGVTHKKIVVYLHTYLVLFGIHNKDNEWE